MPKRSSKLPQNSDTPSNPKPAPKHIFSCSLDLSLASKLKEDLIQQGFEFSMPPYTIFSAKKTNLACTFFQSGKFVVQGKGTAEFVEFYLEPEIIQTFSFTHPQSEDAKDLACLASSTNTEPRIGIDESGKGDFFGPLCIAGVFAEGEGVLKLSTLGVCDSKMLTDKAIMTIAPKIRANFEHHIIRISPSRYNTLYDQFKNLNTMLAWGHATTIESLVQKTNCHNIIIDQFAAKYVVTSALKRKQLEVKLTQRHKAESDLVVAAASILARFAFLEGLQQLGEQYDCVFPKGASPAVVEMGKMLVKKYGEEMLASVGKLHFKTKNVILK